jgi:hypothetical protein
MTMSNPPPEDEGLHVRPDESKREPPLLYSAVSRPERGASDEPLASRSRSSSITVFSFVGGFLLLLLAILAIWIYFSEQEPPRPEPLADRYTQRKRALSGTPPVTAASPPAAAEPFVQVTPDMFRVTSIALGDTPLAIINGKRVAEGDSLQVTVGGREIFLHVAKIEDGVVHLAHGQQVIDAHLAPATAKTPGHP